MVRARASSVYTRFPLIPLARSAAASSSVVRESTPSEAISLSSAFNCFNFFFNCSRKKKSFPKLAKFIYLHIATSCSLGRLSIVRSSSNTVQNLTSSSFWMCCPDLTLFINVLKSRPLDCDLSFFSCRYSSTVSCINLASSMRALSLFLRFSSFCNLSSKVEGSMFGNILRKIGSVNSAKGTITKKENGTNLSKSLKAVTKSFLSLRINFSP
mmetsp:Transcript_8442/g.11651  ORF Transcript_8442/g.11651 Transcript_8442/m.11651 type:complete len:212 (-) Transcript_8442:472-1107(-)